MNVNMYKQYLQKMGHWTILRTITVSQNWNAGDVSCKCHASRAKPPLENDANHNSLSSMLLADETCCWKMMQTLGGWFRSHGKTDSCPDVDSVWEYYTKKKNLASLKSFVSNPKSWKPDQCLLDIYIAPGFSCHLHPLSRLLVRTICRIKSPSFGSGWNDWNRVLENLSHRKLYSLHTTPTLSKKKTSKNWPRTNQTNSSVFLLSNFNPKPIFNPYTSKARPTTLCCRQATAKRLMKVLLRSKPWVWWCTGSCRKKRRCRPVVELICTLG